MDLAGLFMFCFISLVIGAVLMLLVQYYIYVRFFNMPRASPEQRNFNEKYALPEDIRENASNFDPENNSPLMAVNLVIQFLFHELKHTTRVRKWMYRKLTMELDELVTKTTTGKLFDKLTLKDLDMGDQFPEIKILKVHGVEVHENEGRIENLDLLMELKYTGNFRIAVDADLVLGKKGSLTLKVKHLSGLARLQFTRKPFSHWSLSFLGDPELDLAIESKFQGRQMQSNISSLISNQIRRAVRRKHTLPKYKIRYKPFFHQVEEDFDGDIHPNGCLEVKISELSRLLIPKPTITEVFCKLTMASLAFISATQRDDRKVLVSIDVEIHKAKNQQIGIVFRQSEFYVEIESVLPNTPAIKSDLKSGDILIAIEGIRVNNIQQVAKIVKALNKTVIVLRIERLVSGIIRNDATLEDTDVYEDLGEMKLGLTSKPISVPGPSMGNSPPRQVRNSSSESSISSTPTNSPKKTKLIAMAIKKTLIRETIDPKVQNSDESKHATCHKSKVVKTSEPVTSTPTTINEPIDVEFFQQHSTIDCSIEQLIHMDDLCRFNLDANCKFLNICVFGKSISGNVLLGLLNIPIKNLIIECSETSLIEMVKRYSLLPPTVMDMAYHDLSSLSGFNPNLCFGDILMAFSWDGNPAQTDPAKKPPKTKSSSEKSEEIEKSEAVAPTPKTHNFVRMHFQRATQCDFCGKKIWLKDAVQCQDCSMNCHKKCVRKCQNSTVCGPVDCSAAMGLQPEFTVTEAPGFNENYEEQLDEDHKLTEIKSDPAISHRQSLTGLIAQGLKRVNSANNLTIPGVSSPLNQNSKSLPPSPQHTPRKQSLANLGVSPFILVTQLLDSIPNDLEQLTNEQISSITEPIINIGQDEDVMTLAKEASRTLFSEATAALRVEKINELLTKLRLALDSETANHSKLLETNPNENSIIKSASAETSRSIEADCGTSTSNKETLARIAFDLVKSEERVQALSVIMLYLCTGLQHAQGVASK